jgi:hypothetical protein
MGKERRKERRKEFGERIESELVVGQNGRRS